MKLLKLISAISFVFSVNLFFAVSEFYFVRHGETDFNAGKYNVYWNMPMNYIGRQQIENLKNMVKTLPIEVIYFSPLKRTIQTKNILNQFLHVPAISMPELKEGKIKFFLKLQSMHKKHTMKIPQDMKKFLQKISLALDTILSDDRQALIVSHGVVYKAICYILDIQNDIPLLSNGQLVHFYQKKDGLWYVNSL